MTVAPPITAHPLHVVVAGAGALGGAALGAQAAAGDRAAGGGQRLHGHVATWTRQHVYTADTGFGVLGYAVSWGIHTLFVAIGLLHVDIFIFFYLLSSAQTEFLGLRMATVWCRGSEWRILPRMKSTSSSTR